MAAGAASIMIRTMTRVLVATFLFSVPVFGADFVVAPHGDDNHPGTAQKPFASIQRAQAAARDRIAAGLTADLVIELRSGRYLLSEPLVFDWRDSGTDQHRVVYTAAEGQRPIISGGQPITGWKQAADGVFEAATGEMHFRELFVGGQRRTRARHPNTGFFRVERVAADRHIGFTAKPGDLDALGDPAGAELVFLHDWSISRIPIKSLDAVQRNVTLAIQAKYEMDAWEKHARYFIENHPAALDAPGEWYLDKARGVVRYRPLPGESPATLEVIAPVARSLVEVRGPAHPTPRVRNLHFRGLTFEHCAWLHPAGGYAAGQATAHERRDGSGKATMISTAVTFDRAKNCSITSCRFARLGGSGLWVRHDCRRNLIEGNHFGDISGNGLLIGEMAQRPNDRTSTANRAANNLIEHCGRQYFGAVAVWVGFARGTRVEHNLIRHHPYTGVSLGWIWNDSRTTTADNVVAYNHIHHVMQVLSDGGGIYTLGNQPGSFLRDNHIHDVPLNQGRAESNGIFMDEGSTGFTVENNLIYGIGRSPIRFHRATTNLIRDNTLGTGPGIEPFRYNATPPKLINKVNNRLLPDASPPTPADLNRVAGAGLQPAFQKTLIPSVSSASSLPERQGAPAVKGLRLYAKPVAPRTSVSSVEPRIYN